MFVLCVQNRISWTSELKKEIPLFTKPTTQLNITIPFVQESLPHIYTIKQLFTNMHKGTSKLKLNALYLLFIKLRANYESFQRATL